MRAIRYSRTFFLDLETLLSQGLDRFGVRVVAEKRDLVLAAITRTLRHFPVRPPAPISASASSVWHARPLSYSTTMMTPSFASTLSFMGVPIAAASI